MLTSLHIGDFLLVREARLEFAPGLNVLTGETGTGKSILLRGLALLFGRRADPDWIRPGAPALRVEAEFRPSARVLRTVHDLGLPVDQERLVVVREVRCSGPSRAFVNGSPALLRTLVRLGDELIEFHGQREEERFRKPEAQRDLLDLFAGNGPLRAAFRSAYREWDTAQQRLAAHRERIATLAREEDWLRYQVEEIERLAFEPDELETLRERAQLSRRAERLVETAALAEELLVSRHGAVLAALEELDHRLSGVDGGAGEAWRAFREEVRELVERARNLARRVRELRREANAAGERPEALEERIRALSDLERKHRKPLAEVHALGAQMKSRLEELAAGRDTERTLTDALEAHRAEAGRLAGELTAARLRAGPALARAVARELADIGMADCGMKVVFPPARSSNEEGPVSFGPAGAESVAFEVETNPGQGFRPMGMIASGGEMARLALALRVVLGKRGHGRLAVFDEIDAGLGGAAARSVAARLAGVAQHRQVLLVTHLPIIACAAQRHFGVEKRTARGATSVSVRFLEESARVAEIARMLGGDPGNQAALRHAATMLRPGFPLSAGSESDRS